MTYEFWMGTVMARSFGYSAYILCALVLATPAAAQPPSGGPAANVPLGKGPPPGKGPPRSAEDLIERELLKVWEKVEKQGEKFDASLELKKLQEKLERDFGSQLPEEAADHFLKNADEAWLVVQRRTGSVTNASREGPKTAFGKANESPRSAPDSAAVGTTKPPLVPGFGSPQRLVPGFGDSIVARNDKRGPTTGGLGASLVTRHDTNHDGALDKEEWKSMEDAEGLKGGGGHKRADVNSDGRVDPAELAVWLADRSAGGGALPIGTAALRPIDNTVNARSIRSGSVSDTADNRRSYRSKSAWERLPDGLPPWFKERDANQDGQVAMAEYEREWTSEKLVEFRRFDLNDDAFITPVECLKALELPLPTRGNKSSSVVTEAGPSNQSVVFVGRYDTNRDGVLDKDEWKLLENAEGLKGGGGHKLADADRDNRITRDELSVWLIARDRFKGGPSGPPQDRGKGVVY